MKVVILDIDGVLNTEVYLTSAIRVLKLAGIRDWENHISVKDEYGSQFDPMTVRFLNWIIESTGAKIVISSSWRTSGLGVIQEMWKKRDLPGEVISCTPFDNVNYDRELEIRMWLDDNKDIEAFVILDDVVSVSGELLQNFIKTKSQYGLMYDDALACEKILNDVETTTF